MRVVQPPLGCAQRAHREPSRPDHHEHGVTLPEALAELRAEVLPERDRIDVLEDIIASKRLGEVLADPVGDVVAVVAAIAEEDLHGGERAGHTDRADESAGASRVRLEATRAPSPRLRVPP